jgi:hypothetical protein
LIYNGHNTTASLYGTTFSSDHAYSWSPTEGKQYLGYGNVTSVLAINDSGVMLGVDGMQPFSGGPISHTRSVGVAWLPGSAPAGLTVKMAVDVNSDGQILAQINSGWGILTPVPEPATAGMLLLGLAGVIGATRRSAHASSAQAQ